VTSWQRSGDVYELCLDQAPCNEIGLAMLDALERFVAEVAASSAKVVLLYSARPSGFCAGADLRGLYDGMRGKTALQYVPELQGFIDRIHAMANRFDALRQTTIAALHGVCFGGGFELALLCDVRIADKTARFAFPELRLGLIPGFGGIPRLRRAVPNGVVLDLLLTGRSLNATRAHELGLVSHLVAPGQQLTAARGAARQACLFDDHVRASAKAFAKPLLLDELAAEKRLFMQLIAEERVRDALAEFVGRSDPLSYLARPADREELA
jgi:3-hydroxyacyl-CoA dehydrogenase/enoyl-CoA hydratase/3-hydroxybutyryl-CoA epimerase